MHIGGGGGVHLLQDYWWCGLEILCVERMGVVDKVTSAPSFSSPKEWNPKISSLSSRYGEEDCRDGL